MQHKFAAIFDNRMAGVVSALITDYIIGVLGQDVDNLAFAFIAPLGAYNYRIKLKTFLVF